MINHSQVAELARRLGRVPADMQAELGPELALVGQRLEQRSQANASWSSRIPGAHYVRVGFSQSGGVDVGVDQTAAPHARPYEGLSAGGNRGFFRHPVYGDPDIPWVQEGTRPFLAPAVEETGPDLEQSITDLIHRVVPF